MEVHVVDISTFIVVGKRLQMAGSEIAECLRKMMLYQK